MGVSSSVQPTLHVLCGGLVNRLYRYVGRQRFTPRREIRVPGPKTGQTRVLEDFQKRTGPQR